MEPIRRAIISCHDKTGLVELAELLREFNVEIISTAGTLQVLRDAGIEVKSIPEYTGVEEMMDGRVKSLHAKIHAGLLGIRDNKLHQEQLQAYECEWIDLVVCNLHPVDNMIGQTGITLDEVVDQIDIGGVSMIRSAAKNFRYVGALVNPEHYKAIMHEMRAHNGALTYETRHRLAREAFECAAKYDKTVADYLKQAEAEWDNPE